MHAVKHYKLVCRVSLCSYQLSMHLAASISSAETRSSNSSAVVTELAEYRNQHIMMVQEIHAIGMVTIQLCLGVLIKKL
ncbi:hypothetical protein EB796_000608 [Bugula neritina]|uniref:Uncharacterized protein n=1 Tax=Bugula neritina TaxID=10212 RepID=A0A7J7KSE2_BUGNE|nr:hypothetical protein EB796_000608 [Bugula neritina]